MEGKKNSFFLLLSLHQKAKKKKYQKACAPEISRYNVDIHWHCKLHRVWVELATLAAATCDSIRFRGKRPHWRSASHTGGTAFYLGAFDCTCTHQLVVEHNRKMERRDNKAGGGVCVKRGTARGGWCGGVSRTFLFSVSHLKAGGKGNMGTNRGDK